MGDEVVVLGCGRASEKWNRDRRKSKPEDFYVPFAIQVAGKWRMKLQPVSTAVPP